MRRLLLAILLAAGLALALSPAAGVRAATGTISGQIIGQNGAGNIASATVTLNIATTAGGAPETRTAAAGADGSFRFEGFTFEQNAVYLLRVVYDGGSYFARSSSRRGRRPSISAGSRFSPPRATRASSPSPG
jgi:hypothetical protein